MRALLISLLLASAAAVPSAVLAQDMVQALPGTTDADRLAEQMHALAANPNDLTALIAAGDLSLGLDDLSAAAALFARADKIDPRNARVKAGMGSILVRSERPGEALRYFTMADQYGIDARRIASDRGFAFDLIGEQDRAQRDYRIALKDGSGDVTDRDETLRRYALSLGISGHEAQATDVLEPLLRKTDRSAWRARAFVLAMNGKEAEAARIATTMLPPGMAQGLQPFFDRLPSLPATDRAFAVHFGEVHTTAERLADRNMVPPLAPLAPEPAVVTRVAVASSAPLPIDAKGRKQRGGKARPGRVEIAAAATSVAAKPDLPPPPTFASRPVEVVQLQPLPPTVSSRRSASRTRGPSATQLANAASLAGQTGVSPAAAARVTTVASIQPMPVMPVVVASQPAVVMSKPVAVEAKPAPVVPAPVRLASQPVAAAPTSVVPASVASSPVASVTPGPVKTDVAAASVLLPSPGFTTSPVEVASAAPVVTPGFSPDVTPKPETRASRTSEDSILARLIAGLSIPASELDVAAPTRPVSHVVQPAPESAAHVVAEAKAKEARDEAARRLLADKAVADKKAADKRDAVDRKTSAAKKLADAKKAEEAKEAAEEKKAARANPARIWVQVSGGAFEGDLPKAWAAVKAKAPAVFAGKQGWTTPLRATNRVLAGPFKTGEEARSFVNQLGKNGVSAFTFSSDAGQPVTRLPTK